MKSFVVILLLLFCVAATPQLRRHAVLTGRVTAAGGGGGGIDWLTFTNGIFQFYDADTHSSSNNGTELNVWLDLTGNSYNMTNQGAPYVTNSVLNGHSAIAFQASPDFFRTQSAIKRDQPKTVFIVMKARNGTTMTWSDHDTGNEQRLYYQEADAWHNRSTSGTTPSVADDPTDWTIVCAVFNGASSRLRVNAGTSDSADIGAATTGNSVFSLGVYGALGLELQPVNGWIACAIVFDTALSTTDETTVRDLINSRFAVF